MKTVLSWNIRFVTFAVFVLVVYFVILCVTASRVWDPADLIR
jgi:hypothetical protein